MFFIVVIAHPFQIYLLEYFSFGIYMRTIPFAAWVFLQFVRILM
jgi:hypothetical protein